jgi:transcriptional regulator with GAF, ATPase, and Fis domain
LPELRRDLPETDLRTEVLSEQGRATHVRVQRASLVVVAGPDAGASAGLGADLVRIGTAPDNDLVLTDATVSAHHAEVTADAHGYLLRDVGSTNGIQLGRCRLREGYLAGGLELQLGATSLQVRIDQGTLEVPVSPSDHCGQLVGQSLRMRQLFAIIERVALVDATVLIEGETGTGKELVAEAIHLLSGRADAPFLVFDCGAAPAGILESELFGHAKGAFTGANQARAGIFEDASGGTVLLDEIGELDLALQPKLLRVLERREVRPLGESRYRPVQARILAATNRRLDAEVHEGRFRADLLHRLSVVTLRIPPLRERGEDIPLLVRHLAARIGGAVATIPEDLLQVLASHTWPGNVRELRNTVERFLCLPEVPLFPDPAERSSSHQSSGQTPRPWVPARRDAIEAFEQAYLRLALARAGGNLARAAAQAGVSRQLFHRLAQNYGLVSTS